MKSSTYRLEKVLWIIIFFLPNMSQINFIIKPNKSLSIRSWISFNFLKVDFAHVGHITRLVCMISVEALGSSEETCNTEIWKAKQHWAWLLKGWVTIRENGNECRFEFWMHYFMYNNFLSRIISAINLIIQPSKCFSRSWCVSWWVNFMKIY